MTHVGQKGRFRFAGLLRRGKRFRQSMILCHGFPHFRIDHREAHADLVNDIIITLSGMTDAGHAQHLVVLRAVSSRQVAICHDGFRLQRAPDMIRIDKAAKSLPVFLIHILLAVFGEACVIGKMHAHRDLIRIVRVRPIADGIIFVHVDKVNAPIVGGHGRDHAVQLLLAGFLRQQLLMQGKLFFKLLLFCPGFCFRGLDPGQFRNIHAHAQQAEPSGRFPEGDLGRLQVVENRSRGIRHVLQKYVRLVHGHCLAVVFHKVIRGSLVKDLMICQPDDFLRFCFPGIFREGLVAGKIFAGCDLLGKAHGGHVGQQRGG